MATIRKYRTDEGQVSFTATIRVRGFKSTSRTFDNVKDAKGWADELERELKKKRTRGGARSDLTKLTVADLVEEYLAEPSTQALRSLAGMTQMLGWWTLHYGSTKVMQLGVMTLREARDKLRPGHAAYTVNKYLSSLRSCLSWGRSAGLTDVRWPDRLMLPQPRGRVRYLSDSELSALLTAAAAESPTLHAAVMVSVACGLRQGELLRVKWADVDFERQSLRVLLTKNDESRAVHLPVPAADALKVLKRAAVLGTHIISDARGKPLDKHKLNFRWLRVRKAAGLKDFRWHDLRHSCASYLAQNGASLLELGTVLGHRSLVMTQRYSHLVAGAVTAGHAGLTSKLQQK